MKQFLLTPAAKADLGEIFDYISGENRPAALEVIAKLRAGMRQIAEAPGIGHLREELADEPLRFWPIGAYLIIYRAEVRPLQVIRVLHAARNLRRLLLDEDR